MSLAWLKVRKNCVFISWLSAPISMSSAAARRVCGFVFEYWKQPVSVLTAMYSSRASSAVRLPQSSLMMSITSSPQLELSAARQRLSAKRLLLGWWSMARAIGAPTPSGMSPSLATSTVTVTACGALPSSMYGSMYGL